MATLNKCTMCSNSKRSGTCFCAGCKAYFCRNHFNEHHTALLNELNTYIEENNTLQDQIHKKDYHDEARNKILIQIDEWQRTTIEKVTQVAEQARQQVKLSSSKRTELANRFTRFSTKLNHLKETEDFAEDDLKQLKEVLLELKQEVKQVTESTSINMHAGQADQIAWDRLISMQKKVAINDIKKDVRQASSDNVLVGFYYLTNGNKRWSQASIMRDLRLLPSKMMPNNISHVLILGGGPTGLFMGCLARDQGIPVTIMEKREEMTRTRCVKLLGEILSSGEIAGDIYLFSEFQIDERQKAIESMNPKLFQKITSWLELCTPLQTIQQALREYFISSGGQIVAGAQYDISNNLDSLRHYSNTLVVDCTGYHSVLRNHIQPDNILGRFVEYVLICTFTFDDRYECNELCKYYKNKNTRKFRVIPSIDDTYKTGKRQTHVTCLITIDETIFQQLPKREPITHNYLKKHQHELFDDLSIFLNNLSLGQIRKIHFDTMEFVALPLQVYRSRKMTHTVNDNNLNQHWMLLGDSAMGGPYFQSISMGFEAAIYLAYLFGHMNGNVEDMMTKYEYYMEKLWLAMQIRSHEIQRNKQILQLMCAEDRNAILEKIKVY